MTTMCVPLEKVAEGTSESPGQTQPRTEAERTEANTSLSLLDFPPHPFTAQQVQCPNVVASAEAQALLRVSQPSDLAQLKRNVPVSYVMWNLFV